MELPDALSQKWKGVGVINHLLVLDTLAAAATRTLRRAPTDGPSSESQQESSENPLFLFIGNQAIRLLAHRNENSNHLQPDTVTG
jgi:hypothetical protein